MKPITYVLLLFAAHTSVSYTSSQVVSGSVIWQPPKYMGPSASPKPTVKRQMIDRLRVGKMNVLLEETNLKDVATRLGVPIGQRGDAGDFLSWVCVHGSDGMRSWVLWLESGEIDGGSVGSFEWRRMLPDEKFDKRCRLLSKTESEISLPIPVRLGSTEAEALRILGRPTTRNRDRLLFVHEHDETIGGEPYTSDNQVELMIRNGIVQAITVWKTTQS